MMETGGVWSCYLPKTMLLLPNPPSRDSGFLPPLPRRSTLTPLRRFIGQFGLQKNPAPPSPSRMAEANGRVRLGLERRDWSTALLQLLARALQKCQRRERGGDGNGMPHVHRKPSKKDGRVCRSQATEKDNRGCCRLYIGARRLLVLIRHVCSLAISRQKKYI